MESVAKLKNSPLSPRKMRLLADLIRGMEVEKAIYILKLHQKQMYSKQLEKVLRSAVSNWQAANGETDIEDSALIVKSIQIDGARSLKRIQPAPQGRAHRIRKRFNHITIVVDSANAAVTAA